MPQKLVILLNILLAQIVVAIVNHAAADTEDLVRAIIYGQDDEIKEFAPGVDYFKEVSVGKEVISPLFVAILFDTNPELLLGLDISGASSEDLEVAGAFAANTNAIRIATWISAKPGSLPFRTALLENAAQKLEDRALISVRDYLRALVDPNGSTGSLSWSRFGMKIVDNPDFEFIISAGLQGPDLLREDNKKLIIESVANTGRTAVFQKLASLGFQPTNKAKQNLIVATAKERELNELIVATSLGGLVNEPNEVGMYALQEASPDKEKVHFLISKGASAELNHEGEMTSLERAVRSGDITVVEALLSAGGDPLQQTSDNTPIPLVSLAAKQLDAPLVELLLNATTIDEVNGSSTSTVLSDLISHWAESTKAQVRPDAAVSNIIELLVGAGVDINASSQTRYSSPAEVALIEIPSLLPKLISLGADTSSLFEAAIQSWSPPAFVTLAELRISPPQKLPDGTYIVKKVLDSEERGADVFFANWAPEPPPDIDTVPYVAYSVLVKSVRAIKYFASKGASLEMAHLDISPLEFAIRAHNVDAINALFDSGLPVDSVDIYKRNGFHLVASYLRGSQDRALDASVIRTLLAKGVSLLVRDQWGQTPRDYFPVGSENLVWFDSIVSETLGHVPLSLHQAISTNDPRIVNNAIVHGAPLEEVDSSGNTPLQMAFQSSSPEIVSLLLSAGAKINLRALGEGDDATLFLANEDMSRVVLPFLLTEDVVDRTAFAHRSEENKDNDFSKQNQNIPLEGAWSLTCFNECEGTATFSAGDDYNEGSFHVASTRYERSATQGEGTQELIVEFKQVVSPPVYMRNVPIFRKYTTLGPFDFSLQGSFTVLPCTFSVSGGRPCTPLLKITNSNNNSTMVVGQYRGVHEIPTTTIGPKESAYFDRTSGKLMISISQSKAQEVGFKFSVESGIDAPSIKECCSYSNRAANYVTLIKLRNGANEALQHNSAESLGRYKSLAAVHRKKSIDLLRLQTVSALRQSLSETIRLLESMDLASFELLRIMKSEGEKPTLQRPLIEMKLRRLINETTDAQTRADLESILNYVSTTGATDDELRAGLQRLQTALLRATSQHIETFQLLALEIKEYAADTELRNIVPLTPETKIAISSRVKGLVEELDAAQGGGAIALKKAIGL